MQFLEYNTAVTLKIGPFVDETNGYTAETGLTISQADVRLSKNGGNFAQKNESSACTHDEIGYYDCDIDATDTNTVGRLVLAVHESGARPIRHEYMVLPANVYDSLIGGSDYLQVDSIQVEGADATNTVADAILTRDWNSVTGEASRSALNALRMLRNRVAISGSTMTVYEEDDSTTAWTGTVTTDSGANPVTQVDPT